MNRSKGGVLFKWKRINKHIQPTGLSSKLSLFLGLGCKPLKDVVLHHPHWTIHIGNTTMQKVEQSEQVREALQFEAQKVLPEMVMSIDAIPEMLTEKEQAHNMELLELP